MPKPPNCGMPRTTAARHNPAFGRERHYWPPVKLTLPLRLIFRLWTVGERLMILAALANGYLALARLYAQDGQDEAVQTAFATAADLYVDLGESARYAGVLHEFALYHAEAGRYPESITMLQEAVETWESLEDLAERADRSRQAIRATYAAWATSMAQDSSQ